MTYTDEALAAKKLEYERRKARAKNAKLRTTCTICGADKAKACQGCGTTAYCSTECQRIDWRDRGHRARCKQIRAERAAEAARAEAEAARAESSEAAREDAPPSPPSPPPPVFYGPAPRSRADEVRARIAAEHEAARARREAEPEPEPTSGRFGSACPICYEDWDVNGVKGRTLMSCCCRMICNSCVKRFQNAPCPLCRAPCPTGDAVTLARIRRHVDDDVPEALAYLARCYRDGEMGLLKSGKKAAKLFKRAVELGDVSAMTDLANFHADGDGVNGVKLDQKKAKQLWRMAADRGDALAQMNLGVTLLEEASRTAELGIQREGYASAVAKGEEDAGVGFLKLSAEQNHTASMLSLGDFYCRGSSPGGGHRSLVEGMRWYRRAASNGSTDARARIFSEIVARIFAFSARTLLTSLAVSLTLYFHDSSFPSFYPFFCLSAALSCYSWFRHYHKPVGVLLVDFIVLALTLRYLLPEAVRFNGAVLAIYAQQCLSSSIFSNHTFPIIEPLAATLFLRYTTDAELAPSIYALFSACYAMSFYKSNRKRIQEAAFPWFQGRIRGLLSDFLAFAIVRPLIAPSYSAVRYTVTVIALQVIGSIFMLPAPGPVDAHDD